MPPKKLDEGDWFTENVLRHEDMLRAWLLSRFGGYCDIDDIIQESFLRVLRARERDRMKAPKSYLFATARNIALDRLRHSSVSKTEYLAHVELCEFEDMGMGTSELVARNQELELLTKALQSMPNRCRQVFTLRRVYGMSHEDISRKLNISRNTVSAQLTVGLRKFTQYMEKHCTPRDRL